MQGKYNLAQQFIARILLISLFLQSCSTSINLPNQGKSEEEGCNPVRKKHKVGEKEEKEGTELGKFEMLPIELLQEILTYVSAEEIKEVRGVNRSFYKLTTGYDQPGLVGVENRPSQIINTEGWVINKKIDFESDKLSKLTPKTIPSFAFYQLMGQVKNLPKEFWPYLQGTHVHTLDLSYNQIGDAGASQLAQHLQGSSVHTLHLSGNNIDAAGASQIAQHLQGSKVHTLHLWNNQIGDAGASRLAQHLQGSKVHTLHLWNNGIGDAGASQLAQHLQGTSVHTLHLGGNQIGDAGAIQLAQHLQGTSVHTLHLEDNQIGDAGVSQLAQHLQGTSVHTLHLSFNQIGISMQQLLVEQYPHIKWIF